MLFVISYDLDTPGKDYTDLYSEIKKLGTWLHPMDSTWLVETGLSVTNVRDRLKSVMDSNDKLLVVRASAPGAWSGLPDVATTWLKNRLV